MNLDCLSEVFDRLFVLPYFSIKPCDVVKCDEVTFVVFPNRFGIDFKSYMACELKALGSMEADGLVELNATGLQVTARGQLFLRNISMVFDPYLRKEEGGSPQFSRAL